jgi:DNA-binding transcriptional LysR family regulator
VIADLEHVLGVRLLERDRHGAEPTIYGDALLKRGRTAFDELRDGVKDIEFLTDPTAGEVRVGCHHFLATGLVSAAIDGLSRRYPRIVFRIVTTETGALHRELRARNVDFLLAWKPGPLADDEKFEFIFDDTLVVAAGRSHPWAQRRRIAPLELENQLWALPPPESVVGLIETKAFRARGLNYPHGTVLTTPADVLISQLATGRFLTIVPASVLRFPISRTDIKVLPVGLPTTRVSIGTVTLKNRTLSPVAKLFVDTVREIVKRMARTK